MNLGAVARAVWTALMFGIIVVSLGRSLIFRRVASATDPVCPSCSRRESRIVSSMPVFDPARAATIIGVRHSLRCAHCGERHERFDPDWRAL